MRSELMKLFTFLFPLKALGHLLFGIEKKIEKNFARENVNVPLLFPDIPYGLQPLVSSISLLLISYKSKYYVYAFIDLLQNRVRRQRNFFESF